MRAAKAMAMNISIAHPFGMISPHVVCSKDVRIDRGDVDNPMRRSSHTRPVCLPIYNNLVFQRHTYIYDNSYLSVCLAQRCSKERLEAKIPSPGLECGTGADSADSS